MRYFIYCRKSTEAEDRQVLSIESQRLELFKITNDKPEIEVLEVLTESMSAKAPGRPIFDDLLCRIERGEADGIIAWHPDRLARNSMDGGKIIYLLDQKRLKDLRFASYTFENNPQGKFMLSIIFGYSKYYVDSLSENVKRGNRTKCEKGWRPNKAPLGYLNDPVAKTIVPDPDRFQLVWQMFDLARLGTHSVRQIAAETRGWGLTSSPGKRQGGKYLTQSMVHYVLTNPFYAGIFRWNGIEYRGAHVPMLSWAEFEEVQRRLKRNLKQAPKRHEFPFTGLIHCGECGCSITAETKVKPSGRQYTYYHCARSRPGVRCHQPPISAEALEEQLRRIVEGVNLDARTHEFVLVRLRARQKRHEEEHEKKIAALDRHLSERRRQQTNLTGLRLRDLITDDEYTSERNRINAENRSTEEALSTLRTVGNSFEPEDTAIKACNRAALWFREGDHRQKRRILSAVSSNLNLTDRIVSFDATFPFSLAPKDGECPNQLGWLDAIRTGWAEQDPRMVNALAIFEELLATDPVYLEEQNLGRATAGGRARRSRGGY